MGMKQRILALCAALLLLLAGCGGQNSDQSYPLKVTFLKVGKADGIVLRTLDHVAVIDCGEKSDGEKMLNCLAANGVTEIDYLILTHFDQDHIGGAAKVLGSYPVKHVVAADYTEDSKEYDRLTEAMTVQGLRFERPSAPMQFTLDDCQFTVYPHEAEDYDKGYDNNCSLVTKVIHHGNILLFTGDAMEERLGEVMDIGDCDLLKVPYHGREIGNLGAFLDAVTPEYAVISTSEDELADATLQALDSRGIETYVTCRDGNITAVSDGSSLTVSTASKE